MHRALASTQVRAGKRKTKYVKLKIVFSVQAPKSEALSREFNKLVLHSNSDEECNWNSCSFTTRYIFMLRCSEFPSHFHLTCLCFYPASTDGVETYGNFAARHFQVVAKADGSMSAARHRRHRSAGCCLRDDISHHVDCFNFFFNACKFFCFHFPLCTFDRRGQNKKTST